MLCNECGHQDAGRANFCPRCGSQNLLTIRSSVPAGSMFCTMCGSVGVPRRASSLEVLFVLFISIFLLFIPLMIYLYLRSGKRCRVCGKKALVPLDSPAAQRT